MMEFFGMAAATAALRHAVDLAVRQAVNGASVTLRRPVAADSADLGGPRANLYLYQSEPTAEQRNVDLPLRYADGTLRRRPVSFFDLRFLVSFYGDEARYEPQLMAARVLEALQLGQPDLPYEATEEMVPGLSFSASDATTEERRHQLVEDYLAMRRAGLHFFQIPLSIGELSQLWSFLFHAPYALTVALQCSSVWIESAVEVPAQPQVQQVRVTAQGAESLE